MKPVIDSLIKEEIEATRINSNDDGENLSPRIISLLKKSVQ